MDIYINPDTRINVEGINFTVQTQRTRKEGNHAGERYWESHGYYSNLDGALNAILSKRLVTGSDQARALKLLKRLSAVCKTIEESAETAPSASEAHKLDGQVFGNLPPTVWSKA